MGDGYNFAQLRQAILKLSQSQDWETARKEWTLINVYEIDQPDTCLCGHFPIIEICQIANGITGHHADVGNVCVKRFLGFRSDLIFTGLKRIQKDIEKSLNADAIAFFRQRGAINEWEYTFLQNTMKKRNLTVAQLEKRRSINRKILNAVTKRGFRGPEQ